MAAEIIGLFSAVFLVIYVVKWFLSSRGLPPGPRRYPLVGSLPSLMFSRFQAHKALTAMSETYGDVFTMYLPSGTGCKPTIVISSFQAVHEAMVLQRDAFSGRPSQFTTDFLSHGGKGFSFSDFNATLVFTRKIVHSALRLCQPHLEEKILEETKEIARRVGNHGSQPFDPKIDLTLGVTNIISSLMYGKRFTLDDNEFLESVKLSELSSKFLFSLHICNFFPWLIHLPLPDSKLLYKVLSNRAEVRDSPYFKAKETFQENKIRHLVDSLLQANSDKEKKHAASGSVRLDDLDLVAATGSLFGGGTDTTVTCLRWLIVYLLNHPEIQENIFREIKNVFGKETVKLDERANCDYLQATLTEVFRHASIVPLFAHKTTTNTTLLRYTIPKDTTVLLNMWAINHDKRHWKNPQQFKPERFLDSLGHYTGTRKMSYMPFGAGRRVCIGETLAKREFFLISAALLQKFKFETPLGCSPPSIYDAVLGITHAPKTYNVIAIERSSTDYL